MLSGLRAALVSSPTPLLCTWCEVPLSLGRLDGGPQAEPALPSQNSERWGLFCPYGSPRLLLPGKMLQFLISFRLTDKLSVSLRREEGANRLMWTKGGRATVPPLKWGSERLCLKSVSAPALAEELCQQPQGLVWSCIRPEEHNCINCSYSAGSLKFCLNWGEDIEFEQWH